MWWRRCGHRRIGEQAKAFCRAFAETMTEDLPERFVAHVKIADRKGKVLIDWLRNGLGDGGGVVLSAGAPRGRGGDAAGLGGGGSGVEAGGFYGADGAGPGGGVET